MKLTENKKNVIPLIMITLIGLGLRLYAFRGFIGLDDAEYAKFAFEIAQGSFEFGTYTGPPVFPLRIGHILPAALIIMLLGLNEITMVLYPLIVSILGFILAYLCAAYFFDSRAGLIAATLWAVFPMELATATTFVPDGPGAFYASLGTIGLIVGIRFKAKPLLMFFTYGIGLGLLFGLSWLCKESIAYYVPVCIVIFLKTIRKNGKSDFPLWLGIAAGASGILLVEMAVYHSLSGDWWYRFHEIERNYMVLPDGFFTEGSRWGWEVGGNRNQALIERLFYTGPKIILFNIALLYLPFIGLIASLIAFYKRDEQFFFPSVWLMVLCLMFNFSSSSLSSYMPIPLFERYLYPLFLPAILVTSGFISIYILDRRKRLELFNNKLIRFAVISLIVLKTGHQTYLETRYGRMTAQNWKEDITKIAQQVDPTHRIYTDAISKKYLDFKWHYASKIDVVNYEGLNNAGEIAPGSYLIIQKNYIDWLTLNAGMWLNEGVEYRLPEFVHDFPADWKVLYQSDNSSLVFID